MSKYNPIDKCELCNSSIGPNQKVVVIQHGRTEEAYDRYEVESIQRSDYWIKNARTLEEKIKRIEEKHREIEKYDKWKQGKVNLKLNGGSRCKKLMHESCYEGLLLRASEY